MWYSFRPYVSVAKRRASAAREIARRLKKGEEMAPIVLPGRAIAQTFWGKAWCENLESYSDFENRLPRGRTYVRNGSVIHLEIGPGRVNALVIGSELYKVTIGISPLPPRQWRETKTRCAGQIASLVELLQGRLSQAVMDIVTAREGGLFPKPAELDMTCSCPDWAEMCKHVAAVLYGVGARLDESPELLFILRRVDHLQLIEEAVPQTASEQGPSTGKKTLGRSEVAGVFGIELAEPDSALGGGLPESSDPEVKTRVIGSGVKQKARRAKKPAPKKALKPEMVGTAPRTSAGRHAKKGKSTRSHRQGFLGPHS